MGFDKRFHQISKEPVAASVSLPTNTLTSNTTLRSNRSEQCIVLLVTDPTPIEQVISTNKSY